MQPYSVLNMSIAENTNAAVSMRAPSSGNRNRKMKFRNELNRVRRKNQTQANPVIP